MGCEAQLYSQLHKQDDLMKPSKLDQTDQVCGMRPEYINTSELQVPMCSGYDLCQPG